MFSTLLTQSPGFSALDGQHAGKTWLSEGLEKSTADESLNKLKSLSSVLVFQFGCSNFLKRKFPNFLFALVNHAF